MFKKLKYRDHHIGEVIGSHPTELSFGADSLLACMTGLCTRGTAAVVQTVAVVQLGALSDCSHSAAVHAYSAMISEYNSDSDSWR
jgi:hypothetical protein